MQQDTKTIIKQLKKQLPGMRERVTAAALLLAMSVAMLTSASFAWVTLSKAPEVSDITTSISANGNLEIALSDKDGKAPDKSAVGDSSASGNPITSANLTWGNLVNLTDGYGLNELTLRPAMLNKIGLTTGSPLWGATYDVDGRITKLNQDFAFANWVPAHDGIPGMFTVSGRTEYGVRAIASVTYSNVVGETVFSNMCTDAELILNMAGSEYLQLTAKDNENKYMDTLAALLGDYLTAQFGSGTANLVVKNSSLDYVTPLYNMMVDFQGAYETLGLALTAAANIQQYVYADKLNSREDAEGVYTYTEYTFATLMSASETQLKNTGVSLSALSTFKSRYNELVADTVIMGQRAQQATVLWGEVSDIINRLVHISSCEVNTVPISSISGASAALDVLNKKPSGQDNHNAVITKGSLFDFEKMTGIYTFVEGLTVKASYTKAGITIPLTLTANVYTSLRGTDASLFVDDMIGIRQDYGKSESKGDAVAQDTYGLALDFWVRTNAPGSVLTLNGTLLTVEEQKEVMVTIDGQEYNVYTAKVTVEDTTAEVEAVTKDDKWYWLNNGVVSDEFTPDETPIKKMETIVTVTGAEGANRVWQENVLLNPESTTQGGGSFYVYYADTPEDGQRSLDLLKNIKIAFVDVNNKVLATATMQTGENQYFSVNGKYYVPLAITEGGVTYVNEDGETVRGIVSLLQNEATFITAILYLDGQSLSNDMVLAANEIQGTLNLQFGSSATLNTMGDETLEMAERTITAEADVVTFNYDTATSPMTTNVTLNVAGTDPKQVSARFQRAVSATQGTRMEAFTFSSSGEGVWNGSFTFTAPGTYVLRSVTLDGVEVDLPTPIVVVVEGFTIDSLLMDETAVMTADQAVSRLVTLKFASDDPDKMPKSVQGRFMDEDGNAVNVDFIYDAATSEWRGSANFSASGVYTLEYLLYDGEYTEVPDALKKIVDIKLGMRTEITVIRETTVTEPLLDADGNQVLDENGDPIMITKPAPLTFKLLQEENFFFTAVLKDDKGNEITGQSDVTLYYGKSGSGIASNGLIVPMNWDASGQCYRGEFPVNRAGIYNFTSLQVGKNSISSATGAEAIVAQSPQPPSYVSYVSDTRAVTAAGDNYSQYLFVPNGDGEVHAVIAYSDSATSVRAVFRNLLAQVGDSDYYVTVSSIKHSTYAENQELWTFALPKTGTGQNQTQDGIWQLVQLKVYGVYDAEGNFYEDYVPAAGDQPAVDNPYYLPNHNDSSQFLTDIPAIKVVETIVASFPSGQQYVLGKDNGLFMDAYSSTSGLENDVTIVISDKYGAPLPNVTEIKLILQHVLKSEETYGYYSSAALNGTTAMERFTLTLADSGDGIHYTADWPELRLAGKFVTEELSFRVSGTGVTYSTDTKKVDVKPMLPDSPQVEIYSIKPTVKITGVSPTNTVRIYTATNPSSTDHLFVGNYNRVIDANSAVVYIYCDTQGGTFDQEPATAILPKVTLALSDVPSGVSGTVSIGHQDGATYAHTAAFSNNVATLEVGGFVQGSEGWFGVDTWPTIHPAGEQKINSVTLTYNGVAYTVELSSKLTINNPLNPPTLTYAINDSTFAGTVPAAAVSTTGSTFTVTLPTVADWTYTGSSSVEGEFTATGITSTRTVHTTASASWGRTKYTKYTETSTQWQAVSSLTTWIVTCRVTGWKINGVTYAPGETITLSTDSNITATAVISKEDGTKSTTTTMATKYYVTFGATGDTSTAWSKPSGYGDEVTSTAAHWTEITYS